MDSKTPRTSLVERPRTATPRRPRRLERRLLLVLCALLLLPWSGRGRATQTTAAEPDERPVEEAPSATASVAPQVTASSSDSGSSAPPSWPERVSTHLLESPRLLGDPWSTRSWLEDHGVSIDVYGNYQFGANTRGGRNTSSATAHSGSFDYFARLDTQRAGLWDDGLFLLLAKTNLGRSINPDVGALSDPNDDADFYEEIYVDQLWYRHTFLAGAIEAQAGYLDLQTVLDRNAFANSEDTQFLSTYLDNNNAIVPLTIGFGALLWLRPTDWLHFVTGVSDADNRIRRAGFDTAFDDFESLLVFGEGLVRVRLPSSSGELPGNFRVGTFYDPREKMVFGSTSPSTGAPRTERGDVGVYVSFDQLVFRESKEDEQGLGVFLRWGWRDPDVNRIEHFWSTGAQYLGLVPGRDTDALGVGVYQAIVSSSYRDRVDRDFSRETAVEAYYRIQWTPWLAISPDVQYISQPGGRRSTRDSLVVLLRLRIAF